MAASVLQVTLAAAVAALARGTAGGPGTEDAAELVQLGAFVVRQGADPCQCLSWRDVYAGHGLECGAGQELVWAGGPASKPSLGEEFCTRFYEKVSGNFCTQLYFSKQRTEQWCYVSSACTALNGGGAAGALKWKQCTPGRDTMLGEMTPEQVHKVAEAENMDPGLVLKMSYPVYEQGLRWLQVKRCIAGDASADCAALEKVRAAGKPMIFDSQDGHPPFGLVNGSLAVESHFSPWSTTKKASTNRRLRQYLPMKYQGDLNRQGIQQILKRHSALLHSAFKNDFKVFIAWKTMTNQFMKNHKYTWQRWHTRQGGGRGST